MPPAVSLEDGVVVPRTPRVASGFMDLAPVGADLPFCIGPTDWGFLFAYRRRLCEKSRRWRDDEAASAPEDCLSTLTSSMLLRMPLAPFEASQRKPFDEQFLAAQKAALEADQARLESELQAIAKKDAVGADYHARVEPIGRAPDENVLEEEQYEASRSVEQTLEVHLRDVNAALARLAAGTYGICARCGKPVDRARLEAEPAAATCVEHAR